MTKPTELVPGIKFHSPRKDEGVVTVVCPHGKCTHITDRPQSIHVRGGPYDGEWTEFFIALPDNYPIEEWGASLV